MPETKGRAFRIAIWESTTRVNDAQRKRESPDDVLKGRIALQFVHAKTRYACVQAKYAGSPAIPGRMQPVLFQPPRHVIIRLMNPTDEVYPIHANPNGVLEDSRI